MLVALALLVAQAVNAGLLLKERQERRLNMISAPLVARIVDTEERLREASADHDTRHGFIGRARVSGSSAIRPGMIRLAKVERRISERLDEAAVDVSDLLVARVGAADIRAWVPRFNPDPVPPDQEFVLVSAKLEGGPWINLVGLRPRLDRGIASQIVLQTVVLYIVLLLAVLWLGRRAAASLNRLTDAVTRVGVAQETADIEPDGPADIRQLTTAFNEMRGRIAGMLAEKDRMIGAIGHDLRTPLAGLRVRGETVENPDERAAMIATIEELDGTLEDILSLARLRHSTEQIRTVDVAALVDAVAEDFRAVGADVVFEDARRVTARLRPALSRRAIRNLIDNAVKYGARARIGICKADGWVVVEISDDGPGIAETDRERVFEDFVRLEQSRNRQTGGSGLGLTLAREIIRGEGGEIDLENLDSGGLRVRVRFPADCD